MPHSATLRDYLEVIRRRRVLVLVCVLLAGGTALVLSARSDKVYEAEASLSFRDATEGTEIIGVPPVRNTTPEQRAAVGAETANSFEVLDGARRELRLSETIDDFDDRVQARAEVRTNLVVVDAQDGDPKIAAAIADTVSDEVVRVARRDARKRYNDLISTAKEEYRRAIRGKDPLSRARRRGFEETLAKLRTTRDFTSPVQIAERAVAPNDPVSPRPVRNTLLGAGGGLLAGLMLAFLLASLDRRLRGVREVISAADLPLLGTVRREALGKVNTGDPTGETEAEVDLEAFRVVRTNLDYLAVDDPPKRVLVTSPLPEEGKSTVASSLAVALAIAGRRTLLVECDLRRPVLAERLGIEATPGLTDYLAGHARPEQVVRAVSLGRPAVNGNGLGPGADPNVMAVVVAGSASSRPGELLGSKRFADFLTQVTQVYDAVIIDSPPLLSVGDALEIVQHAQGVVLCVRASQTTRDQLRAALEALGRLPQRPTGLVVTGTTPQTADDYGYYGYAYAYAGRSSSA